MLRRQAGHFGLLGSPLYERLALRLVDDPSPAVAVVGDDTSWDLGLRLFGGVHLDAARRAALRRALDEAGSDGRPLGWAPGRPHEERQTDREGSYELELRLWPEPARLLAHVDHHGNWIDWVA